MFTWLKSALDLVRFYKAAIFMKNDMRFKEINTLLMEATPKEMFRLPFNLQSTSIATEKIFPLGSRFFLNMSRPLIQRCLVWRKAKNKSQKLFSFEKMA